MNFQFIGFFLLTIGTLTALAGEPSPCTRVTSPREVLGCALVQHPNAQRAQQSSIHGGTFELEAEQRPNPELSAKSVFGQTLGDVVLNHEINLTHTIELGGKHGARVERARAQHGVIQANGILTQEEILFKTLHTLYRIRQIRGEIETLDEALQTFSRIQKQFRSRPRLTPDQAVSLSVFDLADSDYRLRRASLESELSEHSRDLELAIGQPMPASLDILPSKREQWPRVKSIEATSEAEPPSVQNAGIKIALAELKLAESELSNAQSLSWPNLKVGPSFESQTSGPVSFFTFGANISFDLPIFQINGGGRALAHAGLAVAERNLALKKMEASNERTILLQRYHATIRALENALSEKEIEKNHRNTDTLFARGMIPSSLVIEAHRQVIDFTKNRNEQELSALEALWKLDILDGKPWEERL